MSKGRTILKNIDAGKLPLEQIQRQWHQFKATQESERIQTIKERLGYSKTIDAAKIFFKDLNLIKLDEYAQLVKISFINPQKRLREFALATQKYHSFKTINNAITNKLFNAVIIQPVKNDEPFLFFKVLGQEPFQLDVLVSSEPIFWLNQGVPFWKGQFQFPDEFQGFTKDKVEVPLQLFFDERIKFQSTPFMKQIRGIFKKEKIIFEKRGGDKKSYDQVEKQVVAICSNYYKKNRRLPVMGYVYKQLPSVYQKTGEATIQRYIEKAVPEILFDKLCLRSTAVIPSVMPLKKRHPSEQEDATAAKVEKFLRRQRTKPPSKS